MDRCPHTDFACEVDVNRIYNKEAVAAGQHPDRYQADVRIKCLNCGTQFRFIGLPAGLDMNGAAVSVDGCEARLAVAPKGEVVTPLTDTECRGFTVRKTR